VRYQFVDCRFDLADPERGRQFYEEGHVPGASFLELEADLSDMTRAPAEGRHPLPDASSFAASTSAAGIGADVHVVAYDDGSRAGAARLWWLLRHFGHEQVSLLRHGLDDWLGELEVGSPGGPAALFEPSERSDDVLERDELRDRLDDPDLVVLDARAPERFLGETEPLDPPPGRIPGAINLPFARIAAGEAVPPELLEAPELAAYCGSGVTACVVLHALAREGRGDARLYPGSYSEWTRQRLPVE
jgi:thiosulfate/3-mercaptopyruvate sulfurtransferase